MSDTPKPIVLLPQGHSVWALAEKYRKPPEPPSQERLEREAAEKARMDKDGNERWLAMHDRQEAYNQGYREATEEAYRKGIARGIDLSEKVSMMIVARRLMDKGVSRPEAASLTGLPEQDLPD